MKTDSKEWNEDILTNLFHSRDRDLIMGNPLSYYIKEDCWYWVKEGMGPIQLVMRIDICRRLKLEDAFLHEIVNPLQKLSFMFRTWKDDKAIAVVMVCWAAWRARM
ncbi:hypothetical protein POM88_036826 [Heracleum sosnowskyi]|uniref:Uncharacterized protein n=1 Tax=Heracleum sosnowskyi TaxID=360622 RepID=A0AAD8HP33_9APIA|nr:hypothetical protein POM88_036826 [Heracleum sosnowskyi]